MGPGKIYVGNKGEKRSDCEIANLKISKNRKDKQKNKMRKGS
jgi:hypothetical protein